MSRYHQLYRRKYSTVIKHILLIMPTEQHLYVHENQLNCRIRQVTLIKEGNTSRGTLSHNAMLILLLFCIVAFLHYYATTGGKKDHSQQCGNHTAMRKKINILIHSGKQSAPKQFILMHAAVQSNHNKNMGN